MAALRNGMRTVIIPKDNEKDLEEIDQTVRAALQFIPVSHVDEILDVVFVLPEGEKELAAEPEAPAPRRRRRGAPEIRQ